MQMIAGTKFQLKQTILIFWTKFSQKGHFLLETEKSQMSVRPWSLLSILNFSALGPTDAMIF